MAIRPGYDIAWFNSPSRSLGDAQLTAEYIAYNIKSLASKSKTKKVFIIGHSQGNINIQWALAFFPSTREYISGFSSLAGDFKGMSQFLSHDDHCIQADIGKVQSKEHSYVPVQVYYKVVVYLVYGNRALDRNTSLHSTVRKQVKMLWSRLLVCILSMTTSFNRKSSTLLVNFLVRSMYLFKVS